MVRLAVWVLGLVSVAMVAFPLGSIDAEGLICRRSYHGVVQLFRQTG